MKQGISFHDRILDHLIDIELDLKITNWDRFKDIDPLKFYRKPSDNQYDDPGKRNGPKEILPMTSQVTFGWLDDPCPVKPDMKY